MNSDIIKKIEFDDLKFKIKIDFSKNHLIIIPYKTCEVLYDGTLNAYDNYEGNIVSFIKSRI